MEIKKEHSWATTSWFDLYGSRAHGDQTNHDCHSWLRVPVSPTSSCLSLPLGKTSLKTLETRVATIEMVSGSSTDGENVHHSCASVVYSTEMCHKKKLESFLKYRNSSPSW